MRRTRLHQKHTKIIEEFRKLARSGEDLTVEYMYEQVFNKIYSSPRTVCRIVTQHYLSVITDEMIKFCDDITCSNYASKLKLFSDEFGYCERESRIIIRHIRRTENEKKRRNN